MKRKINKILIANRGEIAVRILRTIRKLDLRSVAVHSTADENAMHVTFADESVCIGPEAAKESYNNIQRIIAAAELTGTHAVHPGYGFLSENDVFADMLEEHGIIFIGPTGDQIRKFGNKITAKNIMKEAGIQVIPGTLEAITEPAQALEFAKNVEFPLLMKAASCGGGRGQRIVQNISEVEEMFTEAQNEAFVISGDKSMYIERYFDSPKHFEFQIIGDGRGNVICLGERDCSIQRKHQKVLEEGPAAISDEQRSEISKKICTILGEHKYRNAGTVEFLYQDNQFFFIEMNTRIQVEHPVTEMITKRDLIELQIRVASGGELPKQDEIKIHGHAIESRITAEDPFNFTPNPGKITQYLAPGGPNVRVDGALYPGWIIPPHYDSLAAKLITYADTRDECIRVHKQALEEMAISGIKTSIDLHLWLIEQEEFKNREITTQWLEKALKDR